MATITKAKVTTIVLKTTAAIQWIDDNVSLGHNQWTKDDDSGSPAILIDSEFVDELLDAMSDDLTVNVDFNVS